MKLRKKNKTMSKNTIVCWFEFGGLSLKKDLNWRVNLSAKTIVPKSSIVYKAELVFFRKPFEDAIAKIQDAIDGSKKTPRLMDEMDKEELDGLKKDLKEAEKELKDKEAECPVVPFDGLVEQIKYDRMKGYTVLSFRIADDVAAELAKVSKSFYYYKLELTPSVI